MRAALIVSSLIMPALPALAADHPESLMLQGYPMPLERHIRMKEGATGAEVRYFNRIFTGGQECTTDAAGNESCLNWDGLTSYFEVTLEGVTETDVTELKKGAISAIEAACPSARGMGFAPEAVIAVDQTFYRLEASCPAIEAKEGN